VRELKADSDDDLDTNSKAEEGDHLVAERQDYMEGSNSRASEGSNSVGGLKKQRGKASTDVNNSNENSSKNGNMSSRGSSNAERRETKNAVGGVGSAPASSPCWFLKSSSSRKEEILVQPNPEAAIEVMPSIRDELSLKT